MGRRRAIRCLPPFLYPICSPDFHSQAVFPLCPKIERTIGRVANVSLCET